MRKLRGALVLAAVVLVLAVLAYSISRMGDLAAQGSPVFEKGASVTPMATELPDIEYVPVYAGARIVNTSIDAQMWRRLIYEVDADLDAVQAFYETALSQGGWIAVKRSTYYPYAGTYKWADPERRLSWNLKLNMTMEKTDLGATKVVLEYSRYPSTADMLPEFGDARQIDIVSGEGEPKPWYIAPPQVITKTYVTKATLDEIANYYNTVLPQSGWIFFETAERGGRGPVDAQTGSIHTPDGLYFLARLPGSKPDTVVAVELFVTARQAPSGETIVQLKAIKSEARRLG